MGCVSKHESMKSLAFINYRFSNMENW